jgi:hypothetical protein
MAKVKENEVDIGGRKISGDTIITINLKTLFIVLGFLLSGLTTAYVSLSSKISASSQTTSEEIKDLSKEMKELRQQEVPKIREDVKGIDSKVQIIYDFVNRSNYQEMYPNHQRAIQRPISAQMPQAPR